MSPLGCLPILLFLILLALLPFVFAQVLITALVKLHLSLEVAVLIIIGILFGSMVNIPVSRIVRDEDVPIHPLTLFGIMEWLPQLKRTRRETIIAVNLGGCLIPTTLVLYETAHLLFQSLTYIGVLGLTILINIGVCFWLAKPIQGIGIVMPAFIPPFVAALSALLFAPEEAPAVAFVAGVMGPLVGADLLHLREIPRIATGLASIGGAGTFDGIVLSGILAAYLA